MELFLGETCRSAIFPRVVTDRKVRPLPVMGSKCRPQRNHHNDVITASGFDRLTKPIDGEEGGQHHFRVKDKEKQDEQVFLSFRLSELVRWKKYSEEKMSAWE